MIFPKTLKKKYLSVSPSSETCKTWKRAQTLTTVIFRYIKNMTSGNVQRKLDGREGQPKENIVNKERIWEQMISQTTLKYPKLKC